MAAVVGPVVLSLVPVGRALTGWRAFAAPTKYGVAECTAGVDANFPEFNASEREEAIQFCVDGL